MFIDSHFTRDFSENKQRPSYLVSSLPYLCFHNGLLLSIYQINRNYSGTRNIKQQPGARCQKRRTCWKRAFFRISQRKSFNHLSFNLFQFGNTCYCNSVLQALYFCRPFRDRILQYKQHVKKSSKYFCLFFQAFSIIIYTIRLQIPPKIIWLRV